jgi:DNA transformation protein and related proteins
MTPAFIDWVKEVFAPFGPVTVKRMFGGGGVWFEGTMFALLSDERIYLKTGPSNRAAFESEGSEEFVWTNPKSTQVWHSGYFEMPAFVFDDEDAVKEWAANALAAAHAGKAKKPTSRKTSPRAFAGKRSRPR